MLQCGGSQGSGTQHHKIGAEIPIAAVPVRTVLLTRRNSGKKTKTQGNFRLVFDLSNIGRISLLNDIASVRQLQVINIVHDNYKCRKCGKHVTTYYTL